jgi:hypothetical protein
MAIEKLKRYKSPGIDQVLAKLIKAGGCKICSKIHELTIFFLFGTKRTFPNRGKSQSLYISIRRVIKQNVATIAAHQLR